MSLAWTKALIESLTKRYIEGKLHHGLLFTGKKGVGKSLLVDELARTLLCLNGAGSSDTQGTKLLDAGTHPDLIKPAYDKSIGVDLIRDSINQLNQKAHLGGAKVLILEKAHLLTVSASNALLKTLEEPTQNTFILMTSEGISNLLPTILSRCEKHEVKVKNRQKVISWLDSGNDVPDQIVETYWDRPIRLLEFTQDDAWIEAFEWLTHLTRVKSAATMPEKLQEDHSVLIEWIKTLMLKLMRSDIPDGFMERLLSFQQLLTDSERKLSQQGVNKSLVFDRLLSQWQEVNSLS